jgi:hypothetical protein
MKNNKAICIRATLNPASDVFAEFRTGDPPLKSIHLYRGTFHNIADVIPYPKRDLRIRSARTNETCQHQPKNRE